MADYYSTLTANDFIPCSFKQFVLLKKAFEAEQRRREAEYDVDFSIQAEYEDGKGVFIFSEDYFGDDDLTDGFSRPVGQLLSSVGQEYVEFSFSQTCSQVMPGSHGGKCFRINDDGTLVWPTFKWK